MCAIKKLEWSMGYGLTAERPNSEFTTTSTTVAMKSGLSLTMLYAF